MGCVTEFPVTSPAMDVIYDYLVIENDRDPITKAAIYRISAGVWGTTHLTQQLTIPSSLHLAFDTERYRQGFRFFDVFIDDRWSTIEIFVLGMNARFE